MKVNRLQVIGRASEKRCLSFLSLSKFEGLPIFTKDTYEIAINTEGVVRLPNLKLHRTLLVSVR